MENSLGTDLLRQKFGELSLEIVTQTDKIRESLVRNKFGLVCAYNIVLFVGCTRTFSRVHEEIVKGKQIGQAFKDSGYKIQREGKCAFPYSLPDRLKKIFGCDEAIGFVKALDFLVRSKDKFIPYASIIEIYSPLLKLNYFFEKEKGAIDRTRRMLTDRFEEKNG